MTHIPDILRPYIRTAWTDEGNVEAVFHDGGLRVLARVERDILTGEVNTTQVYGQQQIKGIWIEVDDQIRYLIRSIDEKFDNPKPWH